MRKLLFISALISLAGSGCLGKRFVLEPGNLYPKESIIQNLYQPQDVPIPLGFEYLPKESFSYVGSFRVLDLQYEGTALVEDAARFLEDQLPKHGWSYMRREGIYGITLVYVNARSECRMTLHRLGHLTSLHVRLEPRDVKPYGL